MLLEKTDKTLHMLRKKGIIGIDEEDIIPCCFPKHPVAADGDAGALLMVQPYTSIHTSVMLAYTVASIRRAIVVDQYLKIAVCLSEDALDAFPYVFLDIIDGYNYRYFRRIMLSHSVQRTPVILKVINEVN